MQGPQSNGHAAAVPRDDSKTVFVRNVSFQASEAEVQDFFSQAGKVAQVRRQTDDQGDPAPWPQPHHEYHCWCSKQHKYCQD